MFMIENMVQWVVVETSANPIMREIAMTVNNLDNLAEIIEVMTETINLT